MFPQINIDVETYFIVAALTFALAVAVFLLPNTKKSHRWRIKSAKKALVKVRSIEHPAQAFAYLRKVDPFVFEEMLLLSFKQRGLKVKRNRRYTGDGGIDGKIKVDGQWTLIQAKRYSGSINISDVTDFAQLCNKMNKAGLFIHTGKTPKSAAEFDRHTSSIDIVSGKKLLRLFADV